VIRINQTDPAVFLFAQRLLEVSEESLTVKSGAYLFALFLRWVGIPSLFPCALERLRNPMSFVGFRAVFYDIVRIPSMLVSNRFIGCAVVGL
jgi:hypothetical protein